MKRKRKTAKKRQWRWGRWLLALGVLAAFAIIYLDAQVRYALHDSHWQLPARVYARPLVLQAGMALTPEDFLYELRLLGYRSGDGRRAGTFRGQANRFSVATRPGQGAAKRLRFHVAFEEGRVARLQRAGGESLDRVAFEPLEIGTVFASHREDRMLVRFEDVPRSLVDILLLIEDRDFYQHWGISPKAIARALLANLKAGRTVQGGSTITQQLVKNVFLTSSRNLLRKGLEAVMTLLVELHYSKDDILAAYVNEVYLGQEGARAIHGFALASEHYFNRPLYELDPAQVALLVGLVKGPSYYDPWRHPERAKQRRNVVLKVMEEHDMISDGQAVYYARQPLQLAKDSALQGTYPAYVDLVRRQLRRDYSEQELQTQGLQIHSAFDPVLQQQAEAAMGNILQGLPTDIDGAMVVTEIASGDVVALVGGRRMRFAGFNRALDAVRPVGSLIKPAVYLSALQSPRDYTLASVLSDRTVVVKGRDGSEWSPRNFDRQSHGDVLLYQALAQSYNQATARLGMQVGLANVLEVLGQLGVTRDLMPVPALLLGAQGMSPLEIAAMYQTIAANGVRTPLRAITDIANKNGQLLARYPLKRRQGISPASAHLIRYAMIAAMREGTGKGAYRRLPEDYVVAGKTGTTNDLRDSWFAGFAGDYVAVVWLGRDDNQSIGLTGSSGALKVWRDFMASVSRRALDMSPPEDIDYHWVDGASGKLSKSACKGAYYIPFIAGSEPDQRAPCAETKPGVWNWLKGWF